MLDKARQAKQSWEQYVGPIGSNVGQHLLMHPLHRTAFAGRRTAAAIRESVARHRVALDDYAASLPDQIARIAAERAVRELEARGTA